MSPSVLTARQSLLLREFFSDPGTPPSFYLTGGTALSAFHLHHRWSDDLDLFTLVEADFERGGDSLERVAKGLGMLLTRDKRSADAWIFEVDDPQETGRQLRKIDLIREAPPTFGEPAWREGARVDTIENILVAKITSLYRQEPKDFVDLFFIESSTPLRVLDFLDRAKAKVIGFDELQFASELTWLERFQRDKLERFLSDYQLKPVAADQLIGFASDLAAKIIGLFPAR
jgi:predicted nucleotidyltransferase component of viral defense system